MFARVTTVFTFLFFVLPLLAIATAVPRTDSPPDGGSSDSQCDTGPIQCCNQVQSSDSSVVSLLAGLLGIVLGPIEGLVGLSCSPLSVVGGSNSCTAQPVCCTGNNFSGLLVLGCTPISINL
ncbi:Hydrophobin-3 [Leucoagaricus gongylophorus]